MIKKIIAVLLVAVLGATAWFTLTPSEKAPVVTFTKLDHSTFKTDDLKGKVTLVKFWATTCVTCVKQMPQMIRDYNAYHDKGFNTVAVAMSYDSPAAIQNFIKDRQLPFTVTLDDGSAAKAFDQIHFTPVAFLLDREGHIVKRFIGDYDHQEFEQILQKTLAAS